jgi:hypothetical protein
VEAGEGWYLEAGQEVQTPAAAYLPAAQSVHPEVPSHPSPVPQAGHSRQEVEAGAGWYLEAGQEVQALGATHDPSGLAQDNWHAIDAATPFESVSS